MKNSKRKGKGPKKEAEEEPSETSLKPVQTITHELELEDLKAKGDEKNVVWAKMRGYTAWPAQILPLDVARDIFLNIGSRPSERSKTSFPVMFFGKREVAWIAKKSIVVWSKGIKAALNRMRKDGHVRRKDANGSRAGFYISIEQVLNYLGADESPEEWWDTFRSDASEDATEGAKQLDPTSSSCQASNTTSAAGDPHHIEAMMSEGNSSLNASVPLEDCDKMELENGLQQPPDSLSTSLTGGEVKEEPLEYSECPEKLLEERLQEYKQTDELVWKNKLRPRPLKECDVETCLCRPTTSSCGDQCLLRAVQLRCDPRVCPCGEQCLNKPFEHISKPSIQPIITPDKGVGVVAVDRIPRGAFIVEYTGEVIDKEELNDRFESTKNAPGKYMDYYMQLQLGLWIDARYHGNMSRFINSSCQPNCVAERFTDAATNQQRIGIFAEQDIEPETELTYDYLMEPIHHERYSEHLRCRCGAPNCRGFTLKHQSRKTPNANRLKRSREQLESEAAHAPNDLKQEHVATDNPALPLHKEDNQIARAVRPRLDQLEQAYLNNDTTIGIVPVVPEQLEGTCAAQVVQGIPDVVPGAPQII